MKRGPLETEQQPPHKRHKGWGASFNENVEFVEEKIEFTEKKSEFVVENIEFDLNFIQTLARRNELNQIDWNACIYSDSLQTHFSLLLKMACSDNVAKEVLVALCTQVYLERLHFTEETIYQLLMEPEGYHSICVLFLLYPQICEADMSMLQSSEIKNILEMVQAYLKELHEISRYNEYINSELFYNQCHEKLPDLMRESLNSFSPELQFKILNMALIRVKCRAEEKMEANLQELLQTLSSVKIEDADENEKPALTPLYKVYEVEAENEAVQSNDPKAEIPKLIEYGDWHKHF